MNVATISVSFIFYIFISYISLFLYNQSLLYLFFISYLSVSLFYIHISLFYISLFFSFTIATLISVIKFKGLLPTTVPMRVAPRSKDFANHTPAKMEVPVKKFSDPSFVTVHQGGEATTALKVSETIRHMRKNIFLIFICLLKFALWFWNFCSLILKNFEKFALWFWKIYSLILKFF